jgi:hypothetical protein
MKHFTRIGVFSVSGITILGATLLTAPSAFAHSPCTSSSRGHGCVNDPHYSAYVCDDKADNWGVRMHLVLTDGSRPTFGDGDGSGGSCGSWHSPDLRKITQFQVCAGVNGADTSCSDWLPA